MVITKNSWRIYFRILIVQLILLTPFFWFLELLQHYVAHFILNDWIWTYPNSSNHYYDLRSIILWFLAIIGMWSIYYFLFLPYQVKFIVRVLCGALVGYLMENAMSLSIYFWSGHYFLYDFPTLLAQTTLYILWVTSLLIYEFVTTKLVDLRPGLNQQ